MYAKLWLGFGFNWVQAVRPSPSFNSLSSHDLLFKTWKRVEEKKLMKTFEADSVQYMVKDTD